MSQFYRSSGLFTLVLSVLTCAVPVAPAATADFPLYGYDAAYCQYVEPAPWIPAIFYDPCEVVLSPPPCVIEGATSPPPNYANPTPAPPSPTGPAAPTKPAPKVSETRSFYGDPARGAEQTRASVESVEVGFWNLSNQDVNLIVNDQRHFLSPGQSARLSIGRQFAWRIEGRELERERIPDGVSAADIVIRR
jgi:hypothetical protein